MLEDIIQRYLIEILTFSQREFTSQGMLDDTFFP